MWPLLERYCKLAKVKLIPRGADLYEMKLPPSERAHFSGRAAVRVALSLEALERDPDAEMAVLGSPFLAHLLEAIRTRAGRLSLGMIPPRSRKPRACARGQPRAPTLQSLSATALPDAANPTWRRIQWDGCSRALCCAPARWSRKP